MIELVVNGDPFTDFTDATANISLETLSNDFSFTASAVNGFPPFKLNDSVEVLVDGVKRVTGTIEEIEGEDGEGSHTITYSGRDFTGDMLDSQINIINDIRGKVSLKQIIQIALSHIELGILAVDELRPDLFNAAEDVVSPQVGDSVVDFISFYARKRQALLTSDGDGNIVITQSKPTDSGETLQRLIKSDENNILSQSWSLDAKAEFNKYIARGQLDPRASNLSGETDTATIENQGAEVINSAIRKGRQRVIVESKGYSNEQLKDRAKWSKQMAKARATRFRCSVKGHSKTNGDPWDINTLVQINSEVADITRKMLINSLSFNESEGGPTTTSFEFVERNVYTINDRLLSQKPVGDLADAFLAG